MRLRRRLPEALALLGLLLGAGALAWFLAGRPGGERPRHAPAAPATTATPTAAAPPTTPPATAPPPPAPAAPPPPPGTPLDLHTSDVTPATATVAWGTSVPTRGRVALGTPSLGPARWLAPTPLALDHAVTLTGLQPGRTYRVWVSSEGGSQASVDLTTPVPVATAASTGGGAVLLDGRPWFPLLVYGACSAYYPSLLASGITLFAANPCGGLSAQLEALAGRGLSAGADGAEDAPVAGPGLVGTFYPDEPDGRGYSGPTLPAPPRPGLRLLTLTSHFYSGAAPLPGAGAAYPGLVARSDVVGFDLYPLQGWCSRDRLAAVLDAQRELVALAAGRPTFQWIEAAGMNCPADPAVAVTPDTVRAEAWLAIAGGAHGLGFFPAAWTGDVGAAIARVADEVAALQPALLRAPVQVGAGPPGSTVRAAAWMLDGATYVAAVNAGTGPVEASLRVPGVGSRRLVVLGEGREVAASGGSVSDSFAPLQVHLYAAPAP